MKKALFVFAAAAAMLTGCQIDENFITKESNGAFQALIESDATRTALVADADVYHVNWVENDRVSINDTFYYAAEGGSSYTYFPTDTTDGGPVGPFKGYYPAEIAPSGDTPGNLPGVQTYKDGTTSCIPMMAESETYNLTFKNLCSMLKLNITTTEADAAVKKIELKAEQPMAGAYTVVDGAAVVAEGTGVTLTCPKPVAVGATAVPFYISVPANTYTGMTIKVTLANGKNQTITMKAGSSIKAERAKVHEATLPFDKFVAGPSASGKAVLLPGPDFNNAIKALASGLTSSDEDIAVKRIIFDVLNPTTEGTVVSDASSEVPVYASFDKGAGVVTIATAADKIYLGENASQLFYRFNAIQAIENLNVLNSENTTDMSYMFCQITPTYAELSDLSEIDLSWINTEKVTDMSYMFFGVRGAKSFDLSKFNTSNVLSTRYMFGNCRAMESIDLTNFDFSNDTSMAYLFYYDVKLTDIKFPENINTSKVENFRNMFYNCEALPAVDVSKFDTSSACDTYGMFYYCGMLTKLDLSGFKFGNDSTMTYMFAYDSNLVDLTLPNEIDCTNLQFMNSTFRYMSMSSMDMTIFKNTEALEGIRYTFAYCKNLTKVKSDMDLSAVTSASYLFYNTSAPGQTLDLSEFDVSTLAPFGYIFHTFKGSVLNLDNWDTSLCTGMAYMFVRNTNLSKLRLGKDFYYSKTPTCFSGTTSDKTSPQLATGMGSGAITIECTQETADWISQTLWRYVNSGYYTGTAVPVTFKDLTTGTVLTVTWKQ